MHVAQDLDRCLPHTMTVHPVLVASAGRAAARASPLPPPAKAAWRFSAFENAKSRLSSPPDPACNHASFAREPTHATLTRGSGPRRRRLARSAHAIEAERGARRPRWRPPEAARDLRPHGVLRRRLVAGEFPRLQALPRVTALLAALLLAPQAGWPCQHAVLALPRPRRLDGSFAGRQESGQSAACPARRAHAHTARSHMAYAQLNVSRCPEFKV